MVWTNVQLDKASLKETTASKALKFFGILILMKNSSSQQERHYGTQ